VSDAGRPTLSQSQQQTTPTPPPTVTVSKGAPCPAGGCVGTVGSCSSSACAYIVVQTANFPGNVTCSFTSNAGGGFFNENFGPNERRQTRNFFGFSGKTVTATCGGVSGSIVW
jgi:hypothetical protein